MPQPTPGDVHVNAPLTNISVAYIQKASAFVADKVFPVVSVAKQSDLYYLYNKEDFLRDEAKPRAPGTESAGGGFQLSTAAYAALVEAFHKDVDDQLRANADSVLQLDQAATEFVTQKMLIRRERRWSSTFMGTGVWGTDATPSPLWSAGSSDPFKDVETGSLKILSETGMKPNTLVFGAQVISALKSNAAIRDQFKYTSAESIDEAMLARYFGVDNVYIMNSVFTSSVEGNATQTTGLISPKSALLCYSAPAPSIMTPTAGYTFAWTGLVGSIGGIRIKRFRMEHLESDRIEAQMAYSFNKVAASLGYFLNGAVA
jgi:hypothetical protein